MKVQDFEEQRAEKWRAYDLKMQAIESARDRKLQDVDEVPKMIRERCHELTLARYRMYGETVCEYLNEQVIRGHKLLASNPGSFVEKSLKFVAVEFPQVVRREWRLHLLCWVFFLVPLIGMWISIYHDLNWVRSILGSDGMANMDAMYGKGDEANLDGRDEVGANFMMFSFYVNNNIGIDFQIIAGGILAGVGSLFILLMNGLGIGGAMAYVIEYGDPVKFFSFVSGHSSYELVGMVVAGMAGMRIGLGLLNPGRMTRGRALLESGKKGLPLVYGAFLLTLLAAVVEGFWSAHDFAPSVKYSVGIAGWVALALYFGFAGRRSGAA
ncbi:stage II sporulation protein M [Rubritalea marina]|uniref:stage II sporulation protein M n=1 Tax=Rubritalea marina TaxID=361055 RepID=UPI001969E6D2|nr:stage II sporulation protein M [Rubritalea marina]